MKYMLAGYMFLFLYRPFEIYPFLAKVHFERIWMLATIITYIFLNSDKKNKIVLWVPVLLFYFSILMSGLSASDVDAWYKIVELYLKQLVFFWILAGTINTEDDFFFIIKTYICVIAIYEIKSLNEYFFHGRCQYRQGIRRLVGVDITYSDPNAMAATINYGMPYAYAFIKSSILTERNKNYMFIFLFISAWCIVMTGSRAGFITLIINLLLFWFLSNRSIKAVFWSFLILIILWFGLPEDKRARYFTIFKSSEVEEEGLAKQLEDSKNSRLLGLTDGYQMLLKKPIIGYGAGNYKIMRPSLGTDGLRYEAHNLYGQLIGELGIIGMLTFLSLLIIVFKSNTEIIRGGTNLVPFAYANIGSLLMLLVNGLGSHSLYRYTWLWLFGFTSIIITVNNNKIYRNS